MTDSRRGEDQTPLNPPDLEGAEKARQLGGEEAPLDEDAVVAAEDVGSASGGLTGTEIYQGYLEAGGGPSGTDQGVDALLDRDLRSGETSDPFVAADEGLTYVPPTDPVVVPDPDNPEGIQVAAGAGTTAMDEPYDADHHSTALTRDDEVSARVREALLADAATTAYAERLGIETEVGVVTLRGVVDDIEDSDAVVAVASIVTGVSEVRDETEVSGL
jgi:hypothetical protein